MKKFKNNDGIVGVKLACGRGIFYIYKSNIIGRCTFPAHPGFITKTIAKSHNCKEKDCMFLDRMQDCPYWKMCDNEESKMNRIAKKNNNEKHKSNIYNITNYVRLNSTNIDVVDCYKSYNPDIDYILCYNADKGLTDLDEKLLFDGLKHSFNLAVKFVNLIKE